MATPIEILDEMEKEIQQRRLTKTLNREYTWNQFEIDSSNLWILHKTKERIEKECWWIPVGEKYPEENSEIIFYENWKVIIWRYEISISWDTPLFFWNNWMYTNTVTHWMKLPTPPNQ